MRKIIVFLTPIVVLSTLVLGLHVVATALASRDKAPPTGVSLNALDTVVISGTVTGPEGGVKDVKVHISSGLEESMATTDANGFYSAVISITHQISFGVRPPLASRLAQINHLVEGVTSNFTQNFTVVAGSLLSVLPVGSSNEPITSTIRLQTLPLQEDRSTQFW